MLSTENGYRLTICILSVACYGLICWKGRFYNEMDILTPQPVQSITVKNTTVENITVKNVTVNNVKKWCVNYSDPFIKDLQKGLIKPLGVKRTLYCLWNRGSRKTHNL